MNWRLILSKKILETSEDDELDDPIFHVTELTLPDEVIGGDRPTDTSVRHDFYLYGADLDEIPELSDTDEPSRKFSRTPSAEMRSKDT